MDEKSCQRWLIAGQVQGVGYRAWMVEQARALGLDGWVRNRADGAVEALVLGEPASLARLQQACRQGPRHARVERIEVSPAPEDPPAPGSGFRQLGDGA